ncbi:hypothetical protein [Paenibacillus oleatilyticus]|uniref:hypothetical protein n=1 Tax=Paenibacillus oleatilyticus TaxID=2594886 RepID=UPI001C2005F5|nr:hypothetical protein [Paenibacillus oleatilyticus]MBU7320020.1 hypothetical protein [Paenibacillus oleatilyticus]
MNWQDAALVVAGFIGSGVAVIHGSLTQRLMIRPLTKSVLADELTLVKKLVPSLLQFSTFNWFLGGLALIASALWFEQDVRLATSLLVGSSYLYGALVNLWATRGRHPGWMLYTVALGLIAFGVNGPGG